MAAFTLSRAARTGPAGSADSFLRRRTPFRVALAAIRVRRRCCRRIGRFRTRAVPTCRPGACSAIRSSGPSAHCTRPAGHSRWIAAHATVHACRGGRDLSSDAYRRAVPESFLTHCDDGITVGQTGQHLYVFPFGDADFKESLLGRAVLEKKGIGSLRLGHQGLLLDLQHVFVVCDHQVDGGKHAGSQLALPIPDFHRDLYRSALGIHDGTDPGDPARVGLVRSLDIDAHGLAGPNLSDILFGHEYAGEQRIEVRRPEYHVIRVHQVSHLDQPLRDYAGERTSNRRIFQLELRRLVLGLCGLVLELRLFEFLAAEQFLIQ